MFLVGVELISIHEMIVLCSNFNNIDISAVSWISIVVLEATADFTCTSLVCFSLVI